MMAKFGLVIEVISYARLATGDFDPNWLTRRVHRRDILKAIPGKIEARL